MDSRQDKKTTQRPNSAGEKAPRPALIGSQRTVAAYSTCLKRLLVGFADESVQAALICHPNCPIEQLILPSVEVIRHPALQIPFTGHFSNKLLLERLAKFNPTVLHCLGEDQAAFTRWLSRQLALPYILTVNSLRKYWRLLSLSAGRCAKIITPALSIARGLSAARPKFAERIGQINAGTFVTAHPNCFAASRRLPGLVVAHPSNKLEHFANVLGALRHLAVDGHEFMAAFICGPKAEKGLFKLLKETGLLQTVTVVTAPHIRQTVLAAADIFILPRPRYDFDPLLLDAMSVGVAVAACKGGVDDLLVENQTAFLFDPDDQLSIYNCLRHIFDRKEMARKIAARAQLHLKQNHKVSQMVAATLDAYSQAVEWFKDRTVAEATPEVRTPAESS